MDFFVSAARDSVVGGGGKDIWKGVWLGERTGRSG